MIKPHGMPSIYPLSIKPILVNANGNIRSLALQHIIIHGELWHN